MPTHTLPFLRRQRASLLKARQEIAEHLGLTTGVDAAPGGDVGDRGSKDTETELMLSLSEKTHTTLRDIDDALRRIDNGTYGICELTGELIQVERLEALPFARCTVKAQRDREKHSYRTRAYGAVFEDTPKEEETES